MGNSLDLLGETSRVAVAEVVLTPMSAFRTASCGGQMAVERRTYMPQRESKEKTFVSLLAWGVKSNLALYAIMVQGSL